MVFAPQSICVVWWWDVEVLRAHRRNHSSFGACARTALEWREEYVCNMIWFFSYYNIHKMLCVVSAAAAATWRCVTLCGGIRERGRTHSRARPITANKYNVHEYVGYACARVCVARDRRACVVYSRVVMVSVVCVQSCTHACMCSHTHDALERGHAYAAHTQTQSCTRFMAARI